MNKKLGQHYTAKNPFKHELFIEWYWLNRNSDLFIEPFAGRGDLVTFLKEINFMADAMCYDIDPQNDETEKRDSIQQPIWTKKCLIITNPPWLAKNSATRQKIDVDMGAHDNLYKHILDLYKNYAGAYILPASYLTSNIPFDQIKRLYGIILLPHDTFNTTTQPSCLALFNRLESKDDFIIWDGDKKIGYYNEVKYKLKKLLKPLSEFAIHFNHPQGNLMVHCVDNTKNKENIRFSEVGEKMDVKKSDRHIVKIYITPFIEWWLVAELNRKIKNIRKYCEVLLTPFKGHIKPFGITRKRLTFKLIRKIIKSVIE